MVTIKEVAEEAGLAVGTVSRILNNRGYISENSRKKVDDAIKKLNYQPNELARSLKKKKINTIGLIVPNIDHPYFCGVIKNIEKAAFSNGYRLLISNSDGKEDKTKESLEMCVSNRVAGVIICSGDFSEEIFYNADIPIIGYERYLKYGEASVECDNFQGGELAANHLFMQGCRNLLHIGDINGEVPMPADDRAKGFQFQCKKMGINYKQVFFNMKEYTASDYYELLDRLIEENTEIDGIFCNNDILAAHMIQVLKKTDIDIPEDVKIVGFDDSFISELTSPTITTIEQPVEEMTSLCVKLLHDIENGKIVPKRTILPVKLIQRESTS